MPLIADWLPIPTPLDPAEDPPTSIDPLGLTTPAERVGDLLVPGFTVRSWRVRMLTLCAVATWVAECAVRKANHRDDLRLPARLMFERLFVAAIARAEAKDPEGLRGARRTLPGITLARTALQRGEPLTRNNFLKGQAVNGPVGVMARLARYLEILNTEGRPGMTSLDLMKHWSDDVGLPGVADVEGPDSQAGTKWINDVTKAVVDGVTKGSWPGPGAVLWDQLVNPLRLDQIGQHENKTLKALLERDPVRGRLFELLRQREVVAVDKAADTQRGIREKDVLTKGVRKQLVDTAVDRQIGIVIDAVDRYETASALITQAFEALLWGLKRKGRASIADLIAVAQVNKRLEDTRRQLPTAVKELGWSIDELNARIPGSALFVESLVGLRDDLDEGLRSNAEFTAVLLGRHDAVQKAKGKGCWIDQSNLLTLMPGFGVDGDAPPLRTGVYLHPFRVTNSYSIMADLGLVKWESDDEAEAN